MIKRRVLVQGVASALAVPSLVFSRSASAKEAWPTRPIRCIVALPPGGGTDSTGRLAMQALSEALGVPVVVDNKAGAGGTIGSDIVAKAAPNGYTLGIATSSSHAAAPVFRKDLPYDPVTSFTAVTMIGTTSFILIGGPAAGAKDLPKTPFSPTRRRNPASWPALRSGRRRSATCSPSSSSSTPD